MNIFRTFALVLVLLTGSAFAIDYKVDPDFVPPQIGGTVGGNCGGDVQDAIVQPDGKIVLGGAFTVVGGQTSYYLVRLNPDGTRDMTFNSVLTWASTGGQWSCVKKIRLLPDGDLLIAGEFRVNGQDANYARLNPDGSIDSSLNQFHATGRDIVRLPDGKYIVCGARDINSEVYWVAHRIHADGSPDPTFRITNGQGNCKRVESVADGKLLMAVNYFDGTPGTFYRFHSDGSVDPSFQPQYTGSGPGDADFELYPDGKILASYSSSAGRLVQKFWPHGELHTNYPNCFGEGLLPEADGTAIISSCRKFSLGAHYEFADMGLNGRIVPDMDPIPFDNPYRSAEGFVDAGGGKYYVFGSFSFIEGIPRSRVARLMPRPGIPRKARYDFDGDGKTDYAVWRPNNGYWYLYQSTAGYAYIPWGLATDSLAAGDYNEDGTTDIAVFRNGLWYLNLPSPSGISFRYLGQAGDKPMLAYWGGGDRQAIMVRRVEGATVTWRGEVTNGGFGGYLIGSIEGEQPSDQPLVGDFDGDTREEIGYFHEGTWATQDAGSATTWVSFHWGAAGDIPVPEDYDGDGQTDYAVFRPSTGTWWINRSTLGLLVVTFGVSSDIPVPADYDGDRKADIAIYRAGQWWQIFSTTGNVVVANWGLGGDIPIPSQHR